MIKRRFYRFEHGDKDAPSEASSSSDSEGEVEAIDETEVEEEDEEDEEEEGEEEEEEEDGNIISNQRQKEEETSSGLPSDDDVIAQNGGNIVGNFTGSESNNVLSGDQHIPENDEIPFDVKDCVLKIKSVFKCRLCPRIVCLSEETLKAHLNSKRHARSEKLHREGRLKLMLNSDGQMVGETDPDDHDSDAVSAEIPTKPKKKGKGRWKQRKRSRQETRPGKARQSRGKPGKRQR